MAKLTDILVARKKAELEREMAKEETDSFTKTIISKVVGAVSGTITQVLEVVETLSRKFDQVLDALASLKSDIVAAVRDEFAKLEKPESTKVDLSPIIEKLEETRKTEDKPRVWEFTHERDSRGRLSKTTARAID